MVKRQSSRSTLDLSCGPKGIRLKELLGIALKRDKLIYGQTVALLDTNGFPLAAPMIDWTIPRGAGGKGFNLTFSLRTARPPEVVA